MAQRPVIQRAKSTDFSLDLCHGFAATTAHIDVKLFSEAESASVSLPGPSPMTDDANVLADQFHEWLLSYARMLDVERADDAVQEAFSALILRQRRPPPVENTRGYLVRVVQRSVSKKRRSPLQLPLSRDHYDNYPDPDLARAIATLSERQQACLALRFGHDLTIAAIADHLEITESSVRSYLARALDRLAELIGETT